MATVNKFVYFIDSQIHVVEAIAKQDGIRFRDVVSTAIDDYLAKAQPALTTEDELRHG
ncbi:hypothetical protein [Subtercola vilae]|uniref:hypothetical protein n=1 Tax=Subtercola vilae TaxID=2056433 RepID=UPI0013755C91|nr:hypothetical protein [Subtercola vilae]